MPSKPTKKYTYKPETVEKARTYFTLNFEQDYVKGFYADKFALLVHRCEMKMSAREFANMVLKFFDNYKYREWTIANVMEHYEAASPVHPSYKVFNETAQYKELTNGEQHQEQDQAISEQDEMSLLILKNIDLSKKVDNLEAENKALAGEIRYYKQLFKLLEAEEGITVSVPEVQNNEAVKKAGDIALEITKEIVK